MASFPGLAVLSTFDVQEDAACFLSDLLASSDAPADEVKSLVEASLLANCDDFHHLVSCATAIQRSEGRDPNSLEGNDVLTFIWHILAGTQRAINSQPAPWAETDRLIALAKELAANHPHICGPSSLDRRHKRDVGSVITSIRSRHCRPRSVPDSSKSHYWSEEKGGAAEEQVRNKDTAAGLGCHSRRANCASRRPSPATGQRGTRTGTAEAAFGGKCSHSGCASSRIKHADKRAQDPSSSSPYFVPAISKTKLSKRKRAGIVSSVPFPPLSCSHFGLIQEETAHEPFWLLIAVTFLIKTNGQAAIPVFRRVKERFPSPEQLADPRNAEELLGMIRHLGLATNRLKFIQKYATRYLEAPPMAGRLHRVKNYDARDLSTDCRDMSATADTGDDDGKGKAAMEAWEIGHMTKGRYTLDSWRIFCRDKLLGRAQDWDGKGREPEFQPEWMRVMPQDKELRAYLRWMWMRQGWEWDPVTGQRRVLRPELQLAVNEHRVEYDDQGSLRILDVGQQNCDKT
ncbi:hypothetical protein E4U41_004993 [Claviceps citrina]|nr:hypothetical protein E4U41_004993 [Claviceps citrina]